MVTAEIWGHPNCHWGMLWDNNGDLIGWVLGISTTMTSLPMLLLTLKGR